MALTYRGWKAQPSGVLSGLGKSVPTETSPRSTYGSGVRIDSAPALAFGSNLLYAEGKGEFKIIIGAGEMNKAFGPFFAIRNPFFYPHRCFFLKTPYPSTTFCLSFQYRI
jgi:hypothetical protein